MDNSGAKLKTLRIAAGMTQEGFGVKIGIDIKLAQPTIAKWEVRGVARNWLVIVAKALGCQAEDLI